jgi:YgiT-type zinc finger domain-containing protein
MICLICRKADMVDGFTVVTLLRGEFRLIVNAVPARVCPMCGEAFVEEAVAELLLSSAWRRSADGILDSQCGFGALQI